MAKLKLYHQGQLLKDLELTQGDEYFAGRGSQCQFVLDHDRGISRQHVRIVFENEAWTVVLMSRFGGLIHGGQIVDQIRLEGDTRFSIPPYEFEFQFANDSTNHASVSDERLPVEEKARDPELEGDNEQLPVEGNSANTPAPQNIISDEADEGGNFESTQIATSSIIPFLRIMNRANGHEEILKLEGQAWVAGRHPDSEIYINDTSISRKHFEITRAAGGFFIADHNSSNGTTINDERIMPGTSHKLMSGDVITIRNIQITFEVHDNAFDDKIKNLPAIIDSPVSEDDNYDPDNLEVSQNAAMHPYDNGLAMSGSSGPAVIRVEPSKGGSGNSKQKTIRMAVMALALVAMFGYYYINDGEKSTHDPSADPTLADGSADGASTKPVSPEQMKELQAKYELAIKNHQRGNYTLCKEELTEIHLTISSIGDSLNLLKYCEQGIELNLINEERRRKEEKKAEAEAKIQSTVSNCQSQYTEMTTTEKMTECLNEALELDPQNAGALELLERIKLRDDQKASQAAQQQQNANLTASGRSHYKRAADLESRGELRKALGEYTAFLKRGYPAVKTQEESARRSVASIQQNLNQKVSERVSSCKLYVEKSEFKAALKACDEALKEDPKNASASELKARAKTEMSRGLKSIYEDSVLEESLGNLEAAKEKWKTIMGNSYAGEPFYEKAKIKLKKYGG